MRHTPERRRRDDPAVGCRFIASGPKHRADRSSSSTMRPVDPRPRRSTNQQKETDMAKAKSAIPAGLHTITPQLTLDDAVTAIDRYKKALGAEETSRAAGPDGKILHAEL